MLIKAGLFDFSIVNIYYLNVSVPTKTIIMIKLISQQRKTIISESYNCLSKK
jgi:low affinity Fe/Cu permease